MHRAEWIYRDAKLIETGVYPDKGVVITEPQLEQLVRSFRAPVPILVEHRPSPLLLGWLVRVWRRGGELLGRLALFPEADALLRRLRLRGLSVGLSHDLSRLLEVSITASPRVPSAQLFHSPTAGSPLHCSVGALADSSAPAQSAFRTKAEEVIRLETIAQSHGLGVSLERAETSCPEGVSEETHTAMLEARIRALEAELRRREAREQVQQWSLRGQLPPALAPLAEAILLQGDAPVQFSGETTSIAELFRRFVNSLPPQNLLTELAPTPATDTPTLSADALAFLRRAFPDLDPADILQKEVR